MDAKIKRKWLKALRSGKYKQGRDLLRVPHEGGDRFCCLGVLCDVMGREWERYGDDSAYYVDGVSATILPLTLKRAFGLNEVNEGLLVDMNDEGKRFTTIANWIEKNL